MSKKPIFINFNGDPTPPDIAKFVGGIIFLFLAVIFATNVAPYFFLYILTGLFLALPCYFVYSIAKYFYQLYQWKQTQKGN